jgi:hypothetical protein
MADEPGQDLGVFVRLVVVENGVDDLSGWDLRLDGIEEADEFLMPMAENVGAKVFHGSGGMSPLRSA